MCAALEARQRSWHTSTKWRRHVQVAPDGSLRCGCTACGRWKAFARGELQGPLPLRQYEVFTADLIDHLARYIR
jgi:hypothetical protein